MRLVGITSLSQAHPGLVNTRDIDHLVPEVEGKHEYAVDWRRTVTAEKRAGTGVEAKAKAKVRSLL